MFTFTLTERSTDTVLKIEADTGDVYFWEKTHHGKSLNSLMESKSMVDLYELAHVAAKRQDMFDGSVDALARGYALDMEDDDQAEPDPTR